MTRDEVRKVLKLIKSTVYLGNRKFLDALDCAVDLLTQPEQPEIVRCKDCKHSRFFDPCFYCYEFGEEINIPENGFCFMAERRTDE